MDRNESRVSRIKQAQKESLFFKEISDLLMRIKSDDSRLTRLVLSRVRLSPDKKNLTVFLRTDPADEEDYRQILHVLVLYKPSLRTALARRIAARQTPEILFRYDKQFEKQQRLEAKLEEARLERVRLEQDQ